MKRTEEVKELDVPRHAIQVLEEKYPDWALPGGNSDNDDFELSLAIQMLFSRGSGAGGEIGRQPKGCFWNAGITKTGAHDEDGDEITEPIFGFWSGVLQGVTIWQGECLIKRVREALQSA